MFCDIPCIIFDKQHRNLRSVGPRRKQIKEELLTMLGIPSLWKHSREARNLDASMDRKYPERNSDPTNNADSVFMLDIYNQLTDNVMGTEMELSSLSKPALTIRKIRKTGTGIPSKVSSRFETVYDCIRSYLEKAFRVSIVCRCNVDAVISTGFVVLFMYHYRISGIIFVFLTNTLK